MGLWMDTPPSDMQALKQPEGSQQSGCSKHLFLGALSLLQRLSLLLANSGFLLAQHSSLVQQQQQRQQCAGQRRMNDMHVSTQLL